MISGTTHSRWRECQSQEWSNHTETYGVHFGGRILSGDWVVDQLPASGSPIAILSVFDLWSPTRVCLRFEDKALHGGRQRVTWLHGRTSLGNREMLYRLKWRTSDPFRDGERFWDAPYVTLSRPKGL